VYLLAWMHLYKKIRLALRKTATYRNCQSLHVIIYGERIPITITMLLKDTVQQVLHENCRIHLGAITFGQTTVQVRDSMLGPKESGIRLTRSKIKVLKVPIGSIGTWLRGL